MRLFDSQLITGGGAGLQIVAPLPGYRWPVDKPGGAESMLLYETAVGAVDEGEKVKAGSGYWTTTAGCRGDAGAAGVDGPRESNDPEHRNRRSGSSLSQTHHEARAAVQVAIEDKLDRLPEAYNAELYRQKCSRVFEHVFEAYQGDGKSIYEAA